MKKFLFPLFLTSICIGSALVITFIPLGWFTISLTFHYEVWSMPIEYRFNNGSHVNIAVSVDSLRQGFVEKQFSLQGDMLSYADTASYTYFGILSDELTVNSQSMTVDEWISPSKSYMTSRFLYSINVNLYKEETLLSELFHTRDSVSPHSIESIDFITIKRLFNNDGIYSISFSGTVHCIINTSVDVEEREISLDLGEIELTVRNATITNIHHYFKIFHEPFELQIFNPDFIRGKNLAVPVLLGIALATQITIYLIDFRQRKTETTINE